MKTLSNARSNRFLRGTTESHAAPDLPNGERAKAAGTALEVLNDGRGTPR
jgi:hypothetical protein